MKEQILNLFKASLSTASELSENIIMKIADSDKNKKPVVFKEANDIEFMEHICHCYKSVFEKAESIDEQHRSVPDTLDLTLKDEPLLYFFSQNCGSVSKKLELKELGQKEFRDPNKNSSANYTQTDNIIADGANYIKTREQSFLNRDGWRKYAKFHKPQYYLIFTVSKRIDSLRTRDVNEQLATEYDCLKKFIDSLMLIVGLYVINTMQENEPFHAYLARTSRSLAAIKNEVLIQIESQSMTEVINKLTNSVISYQGKLQLYLAYCLSNEELDENLSVANFKDSDSANLLSTDFRNSPLYSNLSSLPNEKKNYNVITLKTRGLSSVIKSYGDKENQKRILDTYHELLGLFLSIGPLLNALRLTASNVRFNGDHSAVHNPTIYAAIVINFNMVSLLLVQCQDKMRLINEINQDAVKGRINYTPGPKLNAKLAEDKTHDILTIANTIVKQQTAIQTRITTIRMMDLEKLELKKEQMIEQTESALTAFENYAIISGNQAREWRSELKKGENKRQSSCVSLADSEEKSRAHSPIDPASKQGSQLMLEPAKIPETENDTPPEKKKRSRPTLTQR
nr:hypothetical protein 1 [Coxiellaceae bacterium]